MMHNPATHIVLHADHHTALYYCPTCSINNDGYGVKIMNTGKWESPEVIFLCGFCTGSLRILRRCPGSRVKRFLPVRRLV